MDDADGLMAFYADFEEKDVDAFRRWHNCEHMAERVAIQGFVRGRRYQGTDAPRRFLMTYETQTAAVLGSEPYHAALNAPTPWTRDALTWFRNPARAIYSKLTDAGAPAWRPEPYALTYRFNADPAAEAHLVGEELPRALEALVTNGAQRARLYTVDEAISGMMTSERQIYSGGPGKQKYLALIELMQPFQTVGSLPDEAWLAGHGARDIFPDRLTVDFALEAP